MKWLIIVIIIILLLLFLQQRLRYVLKSAVNQYNWQLEKAATMVVTALSALADKLIWWMKLHNAAVCGTNMLCVNTHGNCNGECTWKIRKPQKLRVAMTAALGFAVDFSCLSKALCPILSDAMCGCIDMSKEHDLYPPVRARRNRINHTKAKNDRCKYKIATFDLLTPRFK